MTITAQLADGRTLEFPDGTDPAVIQTTVKRLVGGGAQAPNPLEGMPGYQRALVGAGAEFSDMGRGMRQAITRPLNKAGILIPDEDMAAINQSDAQAKERDAPLANDFGANVGRFTTLASTALLPTQTVKGAMALGGLLGGLAPADSEMGRLVNVLVSGGLGGIGQALGNKLATWMQGGSKTAPALSPDELRVLKQAQAYNLTPDQITNTPSAKAMATQLQSLPGSAGPMQARKAAQRDKFGADLFSTMGEAAPEGVVGPGTTENIKKNFAAKYAKATEGVALTQDARLMDDMLGALQRPLTPAEKRQVSFYINQVPAEFDGAFYQSWRSRVGKAAEGASSELKGALKEVQGALDDAFDRQAPRAAKKAMNEVRGQYRNFKTLDPLIRGAEAKGEAIAPMSVAQRAATEENLGGEVADLARIGRIIGREGPNSGTAQNQFARDLLTGRLSGAGLLAGAGAGAAGGGDWQSAAAGGGLGSALGLGAALMGPRIGANVFLSRALRDRTMKGASKAVAKSLASPSAFAAALRKIGQDEQPMLEALMRSGAIGLPALSEE